MFIKFLAGKNSTNSRPQSDGEVQLLNFPRLGFYEAERQIASH
jgi:hypothetical protein